MTTITEDYVSFETAKLLSKKGFDFNAEYESYYTLGGTIVYFKDNPQDINITPRITLQMAMKWIREVHNIYIDISPTYSETEKTIHFIWQVFDSNYDNVGDCEIFYGKYETACEAAIKYCLENLI